MELIEKYQHTDNGYNPFLIRGGWQVAVLNYAPAESAEAIDKLDIHHKTDEAFMLIDGDVVLIAAAVSDSGIEYDMVKMEKGIVYNIPKNVWHKIAMREGSGVYIVENADTHVSDFEFYPLSEEQRMTLCSKIYIAFNGKNR